MRDGCCNARSRLPPLLQSLPARRRGRQGPTRAAARSA